ncbi:ATP synthase mitochondrial F1 complex assembly factor 1 [Balamuthia mandrillaris]
MRRCANQLLRQHQIWRWRPVQFVWSGQLSRCSYFSEALTPTRTLFTINNNFKATTCSVPSFSFQHPKKRHYALRPAPDSLDQLVHMDLFTQETPEKITSLWVNYHQKKPCVVASIPAPTYDRLKERLAECPMFVLPIPRGEGFVTAFMQAHSAHDTINFTFLDEYKQKGSQAEPFMCMKYYTELAESKGLVLCRGDVETAMLTTVEAQYLTNQLQLYYLAEEDKYRLVHTFNHKPQLFDYNLILDPLLDRSASPSSSSAPSSSSSSEPDSSSTSSTPSTSSSNT